MDMSKATIYNGPICNNCERPIVEDGRTEFCPECFRQSIQSTDHQPRKVNMNLSVYLRPEEFRTIIGALQNAAQTYERMAREMDAVHQPTMRDRYVIMAAEANQLAVALVDFYGPSVGL